MHADEADQAEAAMTLQAGNDLLRLDPSVGFIDRRDIDGDVGSQHLALCGVDREPIERSQRIRRHDRAEPLDHIAVVVVMRWLDQDQLEATLGSKAVGHPSGPVAIPIQVTKPLHPPVVKVTWTPPIRIAGRESSRDAFGAIAAQDVREAWTVRVSASLVLRVITLIGAGAAIPSSPLIWNRFSECPTSWAAVGILAQIK